MIPLRGEILRSLSGAGRLLLFRAEGRQSFADDAGAAWRSFFALVLAAPAFFFRMQDLALDLRLEEPNLHFVTVWSLTYILGWFAFPVILLGIGARQGFAARVPAYILYSNWVSLIASYLDLVITDLRVGALLDPLGDLLNLGLTLWLLVNNWWLLRHTLEVRPGQAAALAVLSEATGFLLFTWAVLRTAAQVAS